MQMHLQGWVLPPTLAGAASMRRLKKIMAAQRDGPKLHHLHHLHRITMQL
jgi:hypothetical protein